MAVTKADVDALILGFFETRRTPSRRYNVQWAPGWHRSPDPTEGLPSQWHGNPKGWFHDQASAFEGIIGWVRANRKDLVEMCKKEAREGERWRRQQRQKQGLEQRGQ